MLQKNRFIYFERALRAGFLASSPHSAAAGLRAFRCNLPAAEADSLRINNFFINNIRAGSRNYFSIISRSRKNFKN